MYLTVVMSYHKNVNTPAYLNNGIYKIIMVTNNLNMHCDVGIV